MTPSLKIQTQIGGLLLINEYLKLPIWKFLCLKGLNIVVSLLSIWLRISESNFTFY